MTNAPLANGSCPPDRAARFRRRPRRADGVLGLGLSVLWIASLACTPTASEHRDAEAGTTPFSPLLAVGVPVEAEVASSEVVYRFLAPADHYVRITADAHRVDVELTLLGPDEQLSQIRIPAWRWRPDVQSVVTRSPGIHQLRARALGAATSPGALRLTLEASRPAELADAAQIRAQVAHARGVELSEFDGEKAASITAFHRALQEWREAGGVDGEASELEWLGMVRTELGDYQGALADLKAALAIRRRLGAGGGVADTLYRLGVVHREQGRFTAAVAVLDEAIGLFHSRGEKEGEALTHWMLGYVRRRMADLQTALEHYRRALELFRELGLREREPAALNNLGSIYQGLGEWDRARECFEEALPIARRLGRKGSEASILNNLGWGLKAQGRPATALEYFQDALKIAEELDSSRRRSAYHENIARAHLDLADPATALPHARLSLSLSRESQDSYGEASCRLSLGLALRALGLSDEALDQLRTALAIYRDLGDRGREALALFHLAESFHHSGASEAARESIAAAREIIESVRGEVASRRLQATYLASQRALYELEVELFVRLARSGARSEPLADALAAHERARARSFLDSLTESLAGIRQGVEPSLLAKERALREELNETELRRQQTSREDTERLASVDRKLQDLAASIDLVRQTIRRQSPRHAELTQPRSLDLERVRRELLDDDSLLLEYALGGDQSYLFALTKDRIDVYDLPPRRDLEAAAKRAYGLWSPHPGESQAPAPALLEQAAGLGQLLLGPVADRLAGRRILLITEGALQYVPFAALINPADPESRLLIVTNELVSLPSISSFTVLRRELADRENAPHKLAVLADPVFAPGDPRVASKRPRDRGEAPETASQALMRSAAESGIPRFQRLPKTRAEAIALAAMVPPEERLLAVDFKASRELVLSGLLRDYQILHFATHGFLNSHNPELSGLVLSLVDEDGRSIDGFLRLHDIYNLKLDANLVVLSACQTALGKDILGEGLIGLVRGFMYAGARRIVASLWQVDDRATAELMRRFYRELIELDQRPAAALRAAQIAMLEGAGDGDWRHPYFWAAFTFQGEWRSIHRGT